ncbi:hypothetical protein PG994_004193 [Apiospora phragmitis]|uniref:Uncharacterized protein n=1 Tax=Apiospora phragmitis TaxID=2905665 RepID=A0ABR1VTS3_9PEZI
MASSENPALSQWPPAVQQLLKAAGRTEPRELRHHTYADKTHGNEDRYEVYIPVQDTDDGARLRRDGSPQTTSAGAPTCLRTRMRDGVVVQVRHAFVMDGGQGVQHRAARGARGLEGDAGDGGPAPGGGRRRRFGRVEGVCAVLQGPCHERYG